MKLVRVLFLLLVSWGLSGTAQAVPAIGSFLFNYGFEEHGPVPGGEVPRLARFISWTEGGETEQAQIRVWVRDQEEWNTSGEDFWSDWSLARGTATLEQGADVSASIKVSFRTEGELPQSLSLFELSADNTPAGASGTDGNPSGVPEPDTMMLLGLGLLALAGIGRRFTRT